MRVIGDAVTCSVGLGKRDVVDAIDETRRHNGYRLGTGSNTGVRTDNGASRRVVRVQHDRRTGFGADHVEGRRRSRREVVIIGSAGIGCCLKIRSDWGYRERRRINGDRQGRRWTGLISGRVGLSERDVVHTIIDTRSINSRRLGPSTGTGMCTHSSIRRRDVRVDRDDVARSRTLHIKRWGRVRGDIVIIGIAGVGTRLQVGCVRRRRWCGGVYGDRERWALGRLGADGVGVGNVVDAVVQTWCINSDRLGAGTSTGMCANRRHRGRDFHGHLNLWVTCEPGSFSERTIVVEQLHSLGVGVDTRQRELVGWVWLEVAVEVEVWESLIGVARLIDASGVHTLCRVDQYPVVLTRAV